MSGLGELLQDLSDQSCREAAGLTGEGAPDTPGPSNLKPSLHPPTPLLLLGAGGGAGQGRWVGGQVT